MKLTPLEKDLFLKLLETYYEELINAGCNDFYIPNSKEAVEFINIVEPKGFESVSLDYDPEFKEVIGFDFMILRYFINKIKKET